jgi:hypothetical protein
VAECIVAECAAAEAVRGGVARVSRDGCDKSVEDNEMNPEAVAAITAAGECDHATVRGYMDYFLRRTVDGTGALEGLCQGMPVNEPALCGAACAHLSPCIPEDDMSESAPLREPAVCEYFCVTNPAVQTDAWQCVADNDACNAVFGCF